MNDFEIIWKNIDTNEEFKFIVQSHNKTMAESIAIKILIREGQEEIFEIMSIKKCSTK